MPNFIRIQMSTQNWNFTTKKALICGQDRNFKDILIKFGTYYFDIGTSPIEFEHNLVDLDRL